jgi:hypothetical protein
LEICLNANIPKLKLSAGKRNRFALLKYIFNVIPVRNTFLRHWVTAEVNKELLLSHKQARNTAATLLFEAYRDSLEYGLQHQQQHI